MRELSDCTGDGIYSYIIPKDTKVFQSDIIVTAYDRFGKENANCPNLKNASGDGEISDGVFAMIETEKPEAAISKPKKDGVERADDQIWYNSNKEINISASGPDKIKYRLVSYDNVEKKDETLGEADINDGIAAIHIPAGFKGQIYAQAFDNVGNNSEEITPKGFVSDETATEINISEIGSSRYSDANGNKLFTNDVSVTVTITDTIIPLI